MNQWVHIVSFVTAVCSVSVVTAGTTVTVVDGKVNDAFVGMYTSQLQALVVDSMFEPVNDTSWQYPIVNSTVFRYLELQGDYLVDLPLTLPSLLVVKLSPSSSLVQAPNCTVVNITRFTGAIQMAGHYSGVIGGTINTSLLPTPNGSRGFLAVAIQGGTYNFVRGVRAQGYSDTCIGVNTGHSHEVSECDTGGDAVSPMAGRGIWVLASSRVMVHDNYVHHCKSHALDFDAYTSSSAAFNNLCTDNGEEGIFVEETASANMIFNNTCLRNGAGIGIYSNAVGPVTNNFVIGNIVADNIGGGISAGGYGHNPTKISVGNIFINNEASNNTRYNYNPTHGANIGDWWSGNTVASGEDKFTTLNAKSTSQNVSIVKP